MDLVDERGVAASVAFQDVSESLAGLICTCSREGHDKLCDIVKVHKLVRVATPRIWSLNDVFLLIFNQISICMNRILLWNNKQIEKASCFIDWIDKQIEKASCFIDWIDKQIKKASCFIDWIDKQIKKASCFIDWIDKQIKKSPD